MKLSKKLITLGLFAGALISSHASVPKFSAWTGNTRQSVKFLLNGTIYGVDNRSKMLSDFFEKSYAPNQKIMFGDVLPLIYLASMLSKVDNLETILADQSSIVAVENPLGNTPMHFAAVNSSACLQLLINDGRLDVNEHNKNGETPLFLAIKSHPCGKNVDTSTVEMSSLDGTIQDLLSASKINVNSTDNYKRTMIHIAVKEGALEALKIMKSSKFAAGDQNTSSESDQELKKTIDWDAKDMWGNSALDYIFEVEDMDTRKEIYDLLKTETEFTITSAKLNNIKSAAQKIGINLNDDDEDCIAKNIKLTVKNTDNAETDVASAQREAIKTAAQKIVNACDAESAGETLTEIIKQHGNIETAIEAIRALPAFADDAMVDLNSEAVKTAAALYDIEDELKNL